MYFVNCTLQETGVAHTGNPIVQNIGWIINDILNILSQFLQTNLKLIATGPQKIQS